MPDTTPSDLAALMSRRLCHDLAGPIGALLNGTELAKEGHGDPQEILALLHQAAQEATARLRFARLAFGAQGMRAGFSLAKIREAVEDLLAGSAVSLHWRVGGAITPNFDGRILLNALLALLACLPNGGEARVESDPNDANTILLSVHGSQARLSPSMRKLLSGEETTPPHDSRQAPAFFAATLAKESGTIILAHDARNEAHARIVAAAP